MDLFTLFQTGVYRHRCGGIFTTRELAISAAIELAKAEPDNHHNWNVFMFTADEVNDDHTIGGEYDHAKLIGWCDRVMAMRGEFRTHVEEEPLGPGVLRDAKGVPLNEGGTAVEP